MHLVGLIYHLQKLHWRVVYKIGYRARLLFLLWIVQEGNPNSQTVGCLPFPKHSTCHMSQVNRVFLDLWERSQQS